MLDTALEAKVLANKDESKCFKPLIAVIRPVRDQYLFQKDCDDSSDEKNCRTIDFDEEKYLKTKPPPPPKGQDRLPVTAR